MTRQIIIDAEDPLVEEIRCKVLASEAAKESLFCFVNQDFLYTREEIASSALVLLKPAALLNTYGERHGTIYDDTRACPKCGAGRLQKSTLVVDPRFLRKTKADFLVTITSDEWIVSRRLTELLREFAFNDCELNAVFGPEGSPIEGWFQLKVLSTLGLAVPPTQFGRDFFHPGDPKNEFVCSQHYLSGLNLISELYVMLENSASQPQLSTLRNRVGRKAGWIVPSPILIANRQLADILITNKISGLTMNVAYLTKA